MSAMLLLCCSFIFVDMETMQTEPATQMLSINSLFDSCESHISNNQYREALNVCKTILETYPISRTTTDKNDSAYQNYTRLAGNLLFNNHNYEGVINLLNTLDCMLEYVNSFYLDLGKKGVHFPSPEIKREDVVFVLQFCKGFHTMMTAKLGQNR